MAQDKEQFKNYRVGEIIGRGRFAIVYRAEKLDVRKTVALKVLNPEFSSRRDIRDQFREQAKLQAKLSHPRQVRVEDLREEHGQFFVAMEYMPLGSLRSWVNQNGMLSFRQVAIIIEDAAEALDYLHGRSLVHGDVKPGNILLMDDPNQKNVLRAKLSDLRLPLTAEVSQTISENLVELIPEYISPEQAGGTQTTPLSDQYSLGIVAYEMLCGQPPFTNKSQVDLYIDHQRTRPTPLIQLNDRVTPELEQVVLRALEKSPANRYSSCGEFARALRAAVAATERKRLTDLLNSAERLLDKQEFDQARVALKDALLIQPENEKAAQLTKRLDQQEGLSKNYKQAVDALQLAEAKAHTVREASPNDPDDAGLLKTFAPPPSPLWRQLAERWKSAGQFASLLLILILICLVSVTMWIDVGADQSLQPTIVAINRTSTFTFTPTLTSTFTPTLTPTPTPTLTPTPTSTPIGGGSGKIAFVSDSDGDFDIYAMNLDGSNQINLTDNRAVDSDLSWSPDGKKIAFSSDRDGNSEIYVMNADGSEQTRLTESTLSDFSPSWSPDGKKIVFVSSRKGNPDIYVMSADGNNQFPITNNRLDDLSPVWSPDGLHIAFISEFAVGDAELFIMDTDGSNMKQLTTNTHAQGNPSWYSDGKKIAYIGKDPEGIWYTNYVNGSFSIVLELRTLFDLSPDNRYLIFIRNSEVELFNLTTKNEQEIGTITGTILDISWSP
jgi:serine/threonine protein kinase